MITIKVISIFVTSVVTIVCVCVCGRGHEKISFKMCPLSKLQAYSTVLLTITAS